MGRGRKTVVQGALLIVGFYVLLNVVGAVSLLLSGETVRLVPPEGPTFGVWAIGTVAYVVAGLAEEFAYRAYLQNKLVALPGGGDARGRTAGAILLGGVLFTLVHVPNRVLGTGVTSPGAIAETFVWVVILGVLLGALYEYTRNVVLVGVLHGTFNWSTFAVAGTAVSDVTLFVGLPVLVVAAWCYRRWASETRSRDFRPQRQFRTAG